MSVYKPEVKKGEKITVNSDLSLNVPNNPVIPYIKGDGIGPDIWNATVRVLDAAVEKAYKGEKKIEWVEVFAGEAAFKLGGEWLPQETLDALKEYVVGIKGPLTTPVGGGIRSLNVTIRKKLDLYACVRPSKWYTGVPSPMKHPEKLDVILFRENTEDVYAGIEWEAGSADAEKIRSFLVNEMGANIREKSGLGIKPISAFGSKRLIKMAIKYALKHGRKSVTMVHKGNIMKYTEGAFKDWGYEMAKADFRDQIITEDELWDMVKAEDGVTPIHKPGMFADLRGGRPEGDPGDRLIIKDRIADQMFQQLLLRPTEYDVLATPNLNGDFLSDAAAAQVGGLGMAAGSNIGDYASVFEATHGTAPKYTNLDKVNPSSLILSGVMMFEHMGWDEAAALIEKGVQGAISKKTVTYDLERQMEGATKVKCSEFGTKVIENMD